MHWRFASGLLIGLLIHTAQAAESAAPPSFQAYDLTTFDHEKIQRSVRAELRDPKTAVFYEIFATREVGRPDMAYVCGYLNARNGFDVYIGRRPFFGILDLRRTFFQPVAVGKSVDYTIEMCRTFGVDVTEPAS